MIQNDATAILIDFGSAGEIIPIFNKNNVYFENEK
jgi:hypothetical protein